MVEHHELDDPLGGEFAVLRVILFREARDHQWHGPGLGPFLAGLDDAIRTSRDGDVALTANHVGRVDLLLRGDAGLAVLMDNRRLALDITSRLDELDAFAQRSEAELVRKPVPGTPAKAREVQLDDAQNWYDRAHAVAMLGGTPAREVDALDRRIRMAKAREPVRRFLETYGQPLAYVSGLATVALVVLLLFPSTRFLIQSTYNRVCLTGMPFCPGDIPPPKEENANTPSCE